MARTQNTGKRKVFFKQCINNDDLWVTCPYCETLFFYLYTELDHIEAIFAGGTNNKNNLLPVCQDCNRSKNSKVLHAWLITKSISPEAVYYRLKKLDKKIPSVMLNYLGFEE